MMIDGAVFDFDGLLVDTEGFHWQAWNLVLKPFDVELSKKDYIDNYCGNSGSYIQKRLIEEYCLKNMDGKLLVKKKLVLKKFLQESEIRLMPFANNILNYFKETGVPLGLVTGGTLDETEVKLRKADLHKMFKVIVTTDEVTNCKPNPESYLLVTNKLNVLPGKCVAFEDTAIGVNAAKRAGLTCFAIPGEFSKGQDFSNADGVFNDLKSALGGL